MDPERGPPLSVPFSAPDFRAGFPQGIVRGFGALAVVRMDRRWVRDGV